jgi:hypothetical protein
VQVVADLAMKTVHKTFENQGLELAWFITSQDKNVGPAPSIADNIAAVLTDAGIRDGTQRLAINEVILNILRKAFYQSTDEERLLFAKLAGIYSLLLALRAEPKIAEYFQNMPSQFILYVGADIIIRALSERYLAPEDQMTVNLLRMLKETGAKLILTDPTLDEVWSHLKASDAEFRNYFYGIEPQVDWATASHASKILIRAYFYAKLDPIGPQIPPTGWENYIGQVCTYKLLHTKAGRHEIKLYCLDKFGFEFESQDDLERFISVEEVTELAQKFEEFKNKPVLALNDARQILAVYGKRKSIGETSKGNPFGYRTWWLTQESKVQAGTQALVKEHGAHYILRPEFILNYISLSPSKAQVVAAYRNIFPSVLGIRLSNRVHEDIFHDVMAKAKEYAGKDDARIRVELGGLATQLKQGGTQQYDERFKWPWDML